MKGNVIKKKICVILIAVLVAVHGTSTYFMIDHYKEANKQAELYDELADFVDAAAQTDAATETATSFRRKRRLQRQRFISLFLI